MQKKSTITANIFSIALSVILFAFFLVSSLISDYVAKHPMSFAILFCVSASTLFALIWPTKSWRWGLWVSSSFWVFLAIVFVSYYILSRQLVWMPALEAISIMALSCLGALLGASQSSRLRQ